MAKPKRAPKPNFPNTRKALRKQKRVDKKIKRKEHYINKKQAPEKPNFTPGKFVRRPADAENYVEVKKKKAQPQPTAHEVLNRKRQKEKREEHRLKSQMEAQRKRIFLQDNDDEDKVIKKLEKRLGLNKTKNKNRLFADDGLDYLLDICDRATGEQIVAAEKHLATVEDQSDFEEDLALVTGKEVKGKAKKKNEQEDVSDGEGNKTQNLKRKKSEESEGSHNNSEADGKKAKRKKASQEAGRLSVNSESDSEASGVEAELSDVETSEDENGSGEQESEDEGSEEDGGLSDGDDDDDDDSENVGVDESDEERAKPKAKRSLDKKPTEDIIPEKPIKKPQVIEKSDLGEGIENPFSDDEVSHLSGDDDDDFGDENDEPTESKSEEKPDIWEDIYGRKRDKEGNVIKEEKGVYIPPHLRNKDQSSDDQEMIQIKRQIKSVLNKLAGTNLHWACGQVEGVYCSHSRHAVSTALSSLWLGAAVGPAATPDRMVAEHAALLAVLQANVAADVGAHFLQVLAKKFDEMMTHPEPLSDKKLDNVVSCLAHLYSFKMYHANLLYDILNRLLEDLTEKNIECILVALRCVGGVLRKEEPLALKTFIHETQAKVAKLNESAVAGTRIKFLLEVLMAVKNNNLTKIPNYDPSYTEQLKKSTKTIVRKGNYITPLNVRLEDLLKADERGKWWVVGSAWEGSRPLPSSSRPDKPALPQADQRLLDLAREQRMNTDVRRSVFCVIMAAEDFMDAFEKLNRLGLRGQQEREIVHVLIACCLQERRYNPYYALLGQKLCDSDRKYQLSIQYTVWDKIKDIENVSKQSLTNLAQFLIHLIMEKCLALSVLKVIQFSDLNKSSVKFMRQILLALLMNSDWKSSLAVFHRVSLSAKLQMFRASLRLFIQHFLVRNAGRKTAVLGEGELALLKERGQEVDTILAKNDSHATF